MEIKAQEIGKNKQVYDIIGEDNTFANLLSRELQNTENVKAHG